MANQTDIKADIPVELAHEHDLIRGPAGIGCSQCTMWAKKPPDWNDVGLAYEVWSKELR